MFLDPARELFSRDLSGGHGEDHSFLLVNKYVEFMPIEQEEDLECGVADASAP